MSAELVAVGLLLACAGLLAALCSPVNVSRWLGYAALALAALAALIGALHGLSEGKAPSVGLAHAVVRIDATSAAFVAIISVIAFATSVYALGGKTRDERHHGRAAAAAANLIWIGSTVVCASGDVWFFLFGWEMVALGFYAAIAYAGNDESAGVAAYYTFVLTHVAGAGIVAGLLILANVAHGFGVVDLAAAGAGLEPATRTAVFFLLLAGFGAKIGLLPLQGWFPYGYSAAPTAIAALMAGGAVNVGFYGIIRFLIGFGGAIPLTWGLIVIILGALGAFFGIAWAQAQRDIRQLAAFSSVENAGLIVVGLGIALVGRSVHLPLLLGLGVAAAYVQIGAHALAKSLLFLCASGMRNAVGSLSFESLGGLIHGLPLHASAGLVAAMSLAALPPLGGFAGEWLILESCMQGFRTAIAPAEVTLALAGAAVGLSAGIGVVAFVKFVGVALLGSPRSAAAANARELASPLQAIALIALGSLAPRPRTGDTVVFAGTDSGHRRYREREHRRADDGIGAARPANVCGIFLSLRSWVGCNDRDRRPRVCDSCPTDPQTGDESGAALDERRRVRRVDAIHWDRICKPHARHLASRGAHRSHDVGECL